MFSRRVVLVEDASQGKRTYGYILIAKSCSTIKYISTQCGGSEDDCTRKDMHMKSTYEHNSMFEVKTYEKIFSYYYMFEVKTCSTYEHNSQICELDLSI